MRQLVGCLLILFGGLLLLIVVQIGWFIQDCFYDECSASDRAVFGVLVAAIPASVVAGAFLVRTK